MANKEMGQQGEMKTTMSSASKGAEPSPSW